MPDDKLKIAVFIDFDNIEIGVKTTLNQTFDIGAVLEAIKERGEVITKVAYGDWKRSGDHGRAMAQHAVRMVQRVMTPGGDKNGADINLALDALEMAFTHAHINAFVVVGGDSDFITLVEKLKQYDRKVFVVGGRAFTSQVMQKNCTEFIAYENVVPERARPQKPARGVRPRESAGTHVIEKAVPLVTRALKVLIDREVSPQLGLLKSTLLQLDSSFSERDYGVSTFREFAEKLAEQGLVSLKQQGRSTLVELPEASTQSSPQFDSTSLPSTPTSPQVDPSSLPSTPMSSQADSSSLRASRAKDNEAARQILEQPDSGPGPAELSLGDGVALVRKVLAEATTPPRWPMYPRQFKQFLKNAQPDFDERKYGSIADLMRACQKDGILRLERDRQGGLRVFVGGSGSRAVVPHGWGVAHRENGGNGHEAAASAEAANESSGESGPPQARSASAPLISEELRRIEPVSSEPVVDAEVTEAIEQPATKPKRATRARKTPAAATGEKKKSATTRKKKAQ
jgi:uncharacterized LabA/DUF88 family protein